MSRSSRLCLVLAVAVVLVGMLLLLDGVVVVVHGFHATAPRHSRRTTAGYYYYHPTTTTTTTRSNIINNNKPMPTPTPMSWQQSSAYSTSSISLDKSAARMCRCSSSSLASRTTSADDTTMIVNGATGTFYNTTTTTTTIAAADDDDDDALPVVEVVEPEEKGQQPVTISPKMVQARQYASYFCNLFPLWTVLTAGSALMKPSIFLSVPSSTFPTQIGLLMLCMGISLRPADFRRVAQRPLAVLLAFVGCYGLMPALAYGIGKLFRLSETLAAGLILVSCINGAQASNLCTYIGQGDLALSILMTTTTTIGAIIMTPLVIQLWLGGQTIPVNGFAMALSTCQVVLVPILLGMAINAKFPKLVQQILPFSPTLGVAITCLLVGTSVAGCARAIATAGASLQLSAFLLHALGGLIGYGCTRPWYNAKIARTFAIQLSMKSSAFGYLLATLHFGPAYAVPSAVSIVWMTVIGSTLAVVSRLFPPPRSPADDEKNDQSVLAATTR